MLKEAVMCGNWAKTELDRPDSTNHGDFKFGGSDIMI